MSIEELRPYQDKTVIIHFCDGETATVKIILVDAEENDVIADIIETDRPQQYKGPANSAYTILAADIASVHEVSG